MEAISLEWCVVWWAGNEFLDLLQQGATAVRSWIGQARAEAQAHRTSERVRVVFLLEGAEECVTQQLQERYISLSQPSAHDAAPATRALLSLQELEDELLRLYVQEELETKLCRDAEESAE